MGGEGAGGPPFAVWVSNAIIASKSSWLTLSTSLIFGWNQRFSTTRPHTIALASNLPTPNGGFALTTAPALTTTEAYKKIEVKIEYNKAGGYVWIDDVSLVALP